VDLSRVTEVFIDATYNTSKVNTHFYAIVAEELGYGIPIGFMLMSMGERENPEVSDKYNQEASLCNRNFYAKAKELGLDPCFIHTDRDFSEINAAKVPSYLMELIIDGLDRSTYFPLFLAYQACTSKISSQVESIYSRSISS